MPRFVVLLHELPLSAVRATHWDFMLEDDDTLLTWALERPPRMGDAVTAEQLADHRREYLEYEGPVSRDRGSVRRWDEGIFEWLEKTDQRISVELTGQRLSGIVNFNLQSDDDDRAQRWSVSLRKS